MSVEWYCEIAGREVGPLTPRQLKAMADRGQIMPNDCVRRSEGGEWILARTVHGLLDADSSAKPPPVPPIARSKPAQPANAQAEQAAKPVDEPIVNIKIDTSSSYGATMLRAQRRRDQQVKLFVTLLGAVLVLAVTVIYIFNAGDSGRQNKEQGQKSSAARDKKATAEPTVKSPRKTVGKRTGAASRKRPPARSPESLEKREGVISLAKPADRSRASVADILGIEAEEARDATRDENHNAAHDETHDVTRNEERDDLRDRNVEAEAPSNETAAASKPNEDERHAAGAAAPVEQPAKQNPLLEHNWTDASTRAVRVGFIGVRIVSAEVVPGPGGASPRLVIVVELANAGAREIEFAGWSRGGVARGAKLFDSAGEPLRPVSLGRAPLPGHDPPMSIAPGHSGREDLAFAPPADENEYVLLELPAAAIGVEDTVRMKIPAEIIARQPQREEPRQPRPGTPEYDFGISETDEFTNQ